MNDFWQSPGLEFRQSRAYERNSNARVERLLASYNEVQVPLYGFPSMLTIHDGWDGYIYQNMHVHRKDMRWLDWWTFGVYEEIEADVNINPFTGKVAVSNFRYDGTRYTEPDPWDPQGRTFSPWVELNYVIRSYSDYYITTSATEQGWYLDFSMPPDYLYTITLSNPITPEMVQSELARLEALRGPISPEHALVQTGERGCNPPLDNCPSFDAHDWTGPPAFYDSMTPVEATFSTGPLADYGPYETPTNPGYVAPSAGAKLIAYSDLTHLGGHYQHKVGRGIKSTILFPRIGAHCLRAVPENTSEARPGGTNVMYTRDLGTVWPPWPGSSYAGIPERRYELYMGWVAEDGGCRRP